MKTFLYSVIYIVSILLWSFVSYKFYNWFVISQISNLTNFQWYSFIGFKLFLETIIPYRGVIYKELTEEEEKKRATNAIITPFIMLGLGYVIYLLTIN